VTAPVQEINQYSKSKLSYHSVFATRGHRCAIGKVIFAFLVVLAAAPAHRLERRLPRLFYLVPRLAAEKPHRDAMRMRGISKRPVFIRAARHDTILWPAKPSRAASQIGTKTPKKWQRTHAPVLDQRGLPLGHPPVPVHDLLGVLCAKLHLPALRSRERDALFRLSRKDQPVIQVKMETSYCTFKNKKTTALAQA
jgi:hypothetical protein